MNTPILMVDAIIEVQSGGSCQLQYRMRLRIRVYLQTKGLESRKMDIYTFFKRALMCFQLSINILCHSSRLINDMIVALLPLA